jgi:hypothetical protein
MNALEGESRQARIRLNLKEMAIEIYQKRSHLAKPNLIHVKPCLIKDYSIKQVALTQASVMTKTITCTTSLFSRIVLTHLFTRMLIERQAWVDWLTS